MSVFSLNAGTHKFSKAKSILVCTNFIFALVGGIVLAASAYVSGHSEWKDLFETDEDSYSLITFTMALGAGILFISAVGMCGAIKESKLVLSFYLLIVLGIFCTQIFLAAVFTDFNSTVSDIADDKFHVSYNDLKGFQKDVTKQIAKSVTFIYENGMCQTMYNDDFNLQIQCDAAKSQWFEDFVNTKCTPDSGVWTNDKMVECREFVSGFNSYQAQNTFCKCKTAIGEEIRHYGSTLVGIAIAIAVLEGLLLIAASRLICCYNKHLGEDDDDDEDDDGAKPRSWFGNNMV